MNSVDELKRKVILVVAGILIYEGMKKFKYEIQLYVKNVIIPGSMNYASERFSNILKNNPQNGTRTATTSSHRSGNW